MAYIDVNKLTKLRFMCHKILPLVYDESLSYYELLCKVVNSLNDTIDSVNALNDNVDFLNDSVTALDGRVEAVEQEIDSFEATITALFNALKDDINSEVDAKLNEVDTKFDSLELDVKTQLAAIQSQVNALEKSLTDTIDEQIAYMNVVLNSTTANLRDYIQVELQKILDQIPEFTTVWVHDPTDGELKEIQYALNNMFIFSCYETLTVDEWNRLGLTINEASQLMYNSLPIGWTIYQWLHDAKKMLVEQLDVDRIYWLTYPHSIVRDYLNGDKVWHDRNTDINWMMWAVSGCFSCDELVTLAFSVDELIAFNISCENYEMKANEIMVRA